MEAMKHFGSRIKHLLEKKHLERQEMKDLFTIILRDETSEIHQGAFLAALSAKGETAAEIAGVWEAIYEHDTVQVVPCVQQDLIDNCGTGMDSFKTFNISTVASIIAAADNLPIARHGARGITSSCGTVDILESVGVDVECPAEITKTSIERCNIGLFNGMSGHSHPQALGRILSKMSFGSVLNISASLANPALPRLAVRGVYAPEMILPVAQVMREIGYQRAIVLHGLVGSGPMGMDEASTCGTTHFARLDREGEIVCGSFTPEDAGLHLNLNPETIAPTGNRQREAELLLRLLAGKLPGPREDIACLNTAVLFQMAGRFPNLTDGVERSRSLLRSGLALRKLEDWVQQQNQSPEKGLSIFRQVLDKAC